MKQKGIKFNVMDEDAAKEYLINNNYYMKLGSYRFNYQKYSNGNCKGQYINLEFAYLKELAIIDMHLRYIIVEMCLSIEHFLKLRLLNEIESNISEDGYHLVQQFIAKDKNFNILKKIQVNSSSAYCKDLSNKYFPYFPAWVFVELISFGQLGHLCAFYSQMYNTEICNNSLINSVRDIRNAAAHSSCLINHLYANDNRPDPNILRMVKNLSSFGDSAVTKKLKNKCIYDFCCLLITYSDIISSSPVRDKGAKKLHDLFDNRMTKHKDWFSTNNMLISMYKFTKDLLDRMLPS